MNIGVPNFAGTMKLDCLFFTVVGDYRHSRPKSETFGQRFMQTTHSGLNDFLLLCTYKSSFAFALIMPPLILSK
jgi:hypothetical protein